MNTPHRTYIIARSRDGALWLVCDDGYLRDSRAQD